MIVYIVVSLASGILFGIMDGVIHANPLAQRLLAFFQPISRTSVNAAAGIVIDLVYGFILAGVFVLLYRSLPGGAGWIKGISFGVLVWFFRTLMNAASDWMMFKVPAQTLGYMLVAGLIEMLLLGVLYGLTLRPR